MVTHSAGDFLCWFTLGGFLIRLTYFVLIGQICMRIGYTYAMLFTYPLKEDQEPSRETRKYLFVHHIASESMVCEGLVPFS